MRIAPGIRLAACTLLASGAALATTTEGGTTGAACQDSEATFADDVAFLRKHVEVIILSDASGGAQVAVVPAYQGRVMTSTASGPGGLSFGWINREVIERGERQPHMTAFGGEDRFWLGPEGGQYAIYFDQSAPFDFAHWQVPEPLDWGGWEVVARDAIPSQFGSRDVHRATPNAGRAPSKVYFSSSRFREAAESSRKVSEGRKRSELCASPRTQGGIPAQPSESGLGGLRVWKEIRPRRQA